MIQFINVHKSYHYDRPVLQDVSVSISKGEFVFLTGASGAGKSTFLKLIYGEEAAGAGEVIVNGFNLERLRSRMVAHLRQTIGIVFQDFRLLPNKTVFENVAIALEVVGVSTGEIERRVGSLLVRVGLERKMFRRAIDLSGGEKQRVAIARAIVNDPEILLADEPTGNLDRSLTWEILALINQIHTRGTTIVLATHDPMILDRYSYRRILMADGKCEDHRVMRKVSVA